MDRKYQKPFVVAATLALADIAGSALAAQPPAPASATPPPPATASAPQNTATLNQPVSRNQPSGTLHPNPPPQNAQQGRQRGRINQGSKSLPQNKAPDRAPVTVHDVRYKGNIRVHGWKMALNGAGVHTTWVFFNKFTAGLYLSNPTNVAAAAISGQGAKAVSISMLTDMSRKDFTNLLHDAFNDNAPNKKQGALKQKWKTFASFFTDLKTHDKVLIAVIPNVGTMVLINGQPHGTVKGPVFARAIIGSWLGDQPLDGGLKTKLLGGQKTG
jgi:hypothetical protein